MSFLRLKYSTQDNMWKDIGDALDVTFVIGTPALPRTSPLVSGEAPVNMSDGQHGVARFGSGNISIYLSHDFVNLHDGNGESPASLTYVPDTLVDRGKHATLNFSDESQFDTVVTWLEAQSAVADDNTPSSIKTLYEMAERGMGPTDANGKPTGPEVSGVRTTARGTVYVKDIYHPRHM